MISPSTPDFLEYIFEILSFVDNLSSKRLFSGYGIYSSGKHFASIIDNTLYLTIKDLELQKKYTALGSKQFAYERKGRVEPVVAKNWWSVPEEALEQPELLEELVFEAFPDICTMCN